MTGLVKGTVTRGRIPPPPEAHMINYARGGAIEFFYGRKKKKKGLSLKTFEQSPAAVL